MPRGLPAEPIGRSARVGRTADGLYSVSASREIQRMTKTRMTSPVPAGPARAWMPAVAAPLAKTVSAPIADIARTCPANTSKLTRSAITLAALTALGRQDELALHVRAARRNGLSEEEIAEVLLHTGVYAGVPAANTAFKVAQQVLSEER